MSGDIHHSRLSAPGLVNTGKAEEIDRNVKEAQKKKGTVQEQERGRKMVWKVLPPLRQTLAKKSGGKERRRHAQAWTGFQATLRLAC